MTGSPTPFELAVTPLAHDGGMASLQSLLDLEPDLAERARALLTAPVNAVLATIRADGTPRVSGIDPWIADGELHLGFMPGSRKGSDLHRDPRLALHGIPWESRKVRDGATDPGEGDVKLTGRARFLEPEAARAALAALAAERGFDTPTDDDGNHEGDVVVIDVVELVVIGVDGQELVVDRWTEAGGRRTFRRT